MAKLFTVITSKDNRSSNLVTWILPLMTFILFVTTIVFFALWLKSSSSKSKQYSVENGVIGSPVVLPNDGHYIQWSILHLNDIYEIVPLDQRRKGGLARVAHLRDLLIKENSHTYTILSGDFLSPSALSQAIVDGNPLNGRQMIASLNTLGVDFVTFGNHEFDLNETELIARMNESTFTWISSNIFHPNTNQSFSSSIPFKIISIEQVQVLLIGLTIDLTTKYVHIINQTSLIPFVQQFLQSISHLKYDVLIALTHLDLSIDIQLSENIPQIDLILGGHEHENYFLLRGAKYTPIYKADGNAFSVYIHRCTYNIQKKQFHVYSTLTKITSDIVEQHKTAEVVNYWYNLGMKGFEQMGFQPNKTVACLPWDVELDGRSTSVRNVVTSLTTYCCQCLLQSTRQDETIVALFNSGSIRIDDILRGKLTQYDIFRILPYSNKLCALSVPGEILANVLRRAILLKGDGMFLSYLGVDTPDHGKTWTINNTDISTSGLKYNIVTIEYTRKNTELNHSTVIILREYHLTHTVSLIDYLSKLYPSC